MKFLVPILIAVVIIVVAIGSCKKKSSNICGKGGKGGSAVVKITPEFANFLIDTCTVYIKYGTHDAPDSGISYDDSAVCIVSPPDTIPVAIFTNLTVGCYYFYGVGYHSTGGHPPNVKGSKIATIEQEDTSNLYLPSYPYIP